MRVLAVGVAVLLLLSLLLVAGCPKPEAIPAQQLQRFQTEAQAQAADARSNPLGVPVAKDQFAALAQQVAGNRSYELQAPAEAAIVYRLYAAALILAPNAAGPMAAVKDGLPWLARAIKVDPNAADIEELRTAHKFFSAIA